MGYAGDGKHVVDGVKRQLGRTHKRQRVEILYLAEEDLLVRLEFETGNEVVAVDGVDMVRRLGDNDDVGTTVGGTELAQVAEGHDAVFEIRLVVLGEKDIDGRLDVTVLEDIVEHNELRRQVTCEQLFHPRHALLADGHGEVGELVANHGRLVTQPGGAVAAVVEDETRGFATIATAEKRCLELAGEQPNQIFGKRGLAGTPGTEVAHTNGGDRRRHLLLDAKRE